MLKMQQCEKCVLAVGWIEVMHREVVGALLMSCTSDCLLAFLPVYPCYLFMPCSPVPQLPSHTGMSTEGKFYSFTATYSLLCPQGNRRRVNACLSCVSSIMICFHLFHVDLHRNDQWEGDVGSLRCKCHRTVVEPELIWHRTTKSILMGNYLCLNQHIPTA